MSGERWRWRILDYHPGQYNSGLSSLEPGSFSEPKNLKSISAIWARADISVWVIAFHFAWIAEWRAATSGRALLHLLSNLASCLCSSRATNGSSWVRAAYIPCPGFLPGLPASKQQHRLLGFTRHHPQLVLYSESRPCDGVSTVFHAHGGSTPLVSRGQVQCLRSD